MENLDKESVLMLAEVSAVHNWISQMACNYMAMTKMNGSSSLAIKAVNWVPSVILTQLKDYPLDF